MANKDSTSESNVELYIRGIRSPGRAKSLLIFQPKLPGDTRMNHIASFFFFFS